MRKPSTVRAENYCNPQCVAERPRVPMTLKPDEGIALIPLCGADGTIKAYATVDMNDAEWAGQWPWHLANTGYATRTERAGNQKQAVLLHRELLGLVPGDGLEGDHINRDRLDNRRGNLRRSTKGENRQNRTKRTGVSSRFRGVHWRPQYGKWDAEIRVNGKRTWVGRFSSEQEAGEATRRMRLTLMPYATD